MEPTRAYLFPKWALDLVFSRFLNTHSCWNKIGKIIHNHIMRSIQKSTAFESKPNLPRHHVHTSHNPQRSHLKILPSCLTTHFFSCCHLLSTHKHGFLVVLSKFFELKIDSTNNYAISDHTGEKSDKNPSSGIKGTTSNLVPFDSTSFPSLPTDTRTGSKKIWSSSLLELGTEKGIIAI